MLGKLIPDHVLGSREHNAGGNDLACGLKCSRSYSEAYKPW